MDEFWIKKAHQYIAEHRSFCNVSEIPDQGENGFIIRANALVGLPARYLDAGITDIGVRSIEPIVFTFSKEFPSLAPIITLRDDFPRCFPHICPNTKDIRPCIYAGDLSELLQQSEWMNGLLNQLVDWLEKAASNSLMNYNQGWEPMRNDDPSGFIIYDTFEMAKFIKESEIGSRDIYYEIRNRRIYTDTLCDPTNKSNRKKSTMFVCRSKSKEVINKYIPNRILNVSDLYNYARKIGIPNLKDTAESFDIKHLDEDMLFIALAIYRPVNLIGSDSNIEYLNFAVYKSTLRKKKKKRLLPENKVGMLLHIEEASQKLMQRLSGSKQQLNCTTYIAILGCGSLGSKISLHLARNGNGPFYCIDKDIFLPHNNARHGLNMSRPMNKALLLVMAIISIAGNVTAIPHAESAYTANYSNSRLVIDTTASLPVRSYLISKTDLPPVISCMLYGGGALGVTLIEGNDRQTRIDDLWADLYLHAKDINWLHDALFSDQKTSVLIGQSCSSHTVVMNDAILSIVAACMASRIQKILEEGLQDNGKIILSRIDDQYNLLSVEYNVAKSIVVPSVLKKEWHVRILDTVIEKMKAQSSAAKENETGGCLIGSVFLTAKSIVITDIIPPPPDSKSSPSMFILGTEGLENRIKTIERKTNAKVTYLGTWHSHPYGGEASDTDRSTAERLIFVRNYEPTVCLIWTPTGLVQI